MKGLDISSFEQVIYRDMMMWHTFKDGDEHCRKVCVTGLDGV